MIELDWVIHLPLAGYGYNPITKHQNGLVGLLDFKIPGECLLLFPKHLDMQLRSSIIVSLKPVVTNYKEPNT